MKRRLQIEQYVLAYTLAAPGRYAWELCGLRPEWFSCRPLRQVATAVCELRDAGRFPAWRLVRAVLRRRGELPVAEGEGTDLLRAMVRRLGCHAGGEWYFRELRRLADAEHGQASRAQGGAR